MDSGGRATRATGPPLHREVTERGHCTQTHKLQSPEHSRRQERGNKHTEKRETSTACAQGKRERGGEADHPGG